MITVGLRLFINGWVLCLLSASLALAQGQTAGDVDNDGEVDLEDARRIGQVAQGLEQSFPCFGARIQLGISEVDFGVLTAGERGTFSIPIQNQGVAPLEVFADLDSGVHYGVAFNLENPFLLLPPAEEGELVLAAGMDGEGMFVDQLVLRSNDEQNPRLVIPVQAQGESVERSLSCHFSDLEGNPVLQITSGNTFFLQVEVSPPQHAAVEIDSPGPSAITQQFELPPKVIQTDSDGRGSFRFPGFVGLSSPVELVNEVSLPPSRSQTGASASCSLTLEPRLVPSPNFALLSLGVRVQGDPTQCGADPLPPVNGQIFFGDNQRPCLALEFVDPTPATLSQVEISGTSKLLYKGNLSVLVEKFSNDPSQGQILEDITSQVTIAMEPMEDARMDEEPLILQDIPVDVPSGPFMPTPRFLRIHFDVLVDIPMDPFVDPLTVKVKGETGGESFDLEDHALVRKVSPDPLLVLPGDTVDFGLVDVNSPPPVAEIELTNGGGSPTTLTLEKILFSYPEPDATFSLNPEPTLPFSLAGGTSQILDATFQPDRAGPFKNALLFLSNDPLQPLVALDLKGRGAVAELIVAAQHQGIGEAKIFNQTTVTFASAARFDLNVLFTNGGQTNIGPLDWELEIEFDGQSYRHVGSPPLPSAVWAQKALEDAFQEIRNLRNDDGGTTFPNLELTFLEGPGSGKKTARISGVTVEPVGPPGDNIRPLPLLPIFGWQEGTYQIRIRAHDSFGNEFEETSPYQIETIPISTTCPNRKWLFQEDAHLQGYVAAAMQVKWIAECVGNPTLRVAGNMELLGAGLVQDLIGGSDFKLFGFLQGESLVKLFNGMASGVFAGIQPSVGVEFAELWKPFLKNVGVDVIAPQLAFFQLRWWHSDAVLDAFAANLSLFNNKVSVNASLAIPEETLNQLVVDGLLRERTAEVLKNAKLTVGASGDLSSSALNASASAPQDLLATTQKEVKKKPRLKFRLPTPTIAGMFGYVNLTFTPFQP